MAGSWIDTSQGKESDTVLKQLILMNSYSK